MAALVAAIHFPEAVQELSVSGKWMAGTSPAMTEKERDLARQNKKGASRKGRAQFREETLALFSRARSRHAG
jgi:hypothetical protein